MVFPNVKKRLFVPVAVAGLLISLLSMSATAQNTSPTFGGFQLQLHSTTFNNNTTLPISTINNIVQNGVNACSINGSTGGNESPELSWIGAPPGTRTFVVTTYDVTASFTHWGMYNIPGYINSLPQNAGLAGSTFGPQIVNDFGVAAYGGPCPPANVAPFVHHYIFTVYALDIVLSLPGTANFPNNAETLYQALIAAGRQDHILASASIVGLYSTTK